MILGSLLRDRISIQERRNHQGLKKTVPDAEHDEAVFIEPTQKSL